VPLPQRTLDVLRLLWRTHRHPKFLFPAKGHNGRGAPTAVRPMCRSTLQLAFRQALQASGVNAAKTPVSSLRSPGNSIAASRWKPVVHAPPCHGRQGRFHPPREGSHFPQSVSWHAGRPATQRLRSTLECKEREGGQRSSEVRVQIATPPIPPSRSLHSFRAVRRHWCHVKRHGERV
jgi:hypothetical protein